jgi:CBS-domain-containing membrane protein
VKRLPVIDANGKVVGIVSRADLLKVFLRPDHETRDEIEDTLARASFQPVRSMSPLWMASRPSRGGSN